MSFFSTAADAGKPARKNVLHLFLSLSVAAFGLAGCDNASPQKVFDVAILNVNMMHGFAGDGLFRQLESPTVRMVNSDPNKTEPMKRKEVIDDKIMYVEEAYDKVKNLKENKENSEVLSASRAIYEYVLPVYKNEYNQLARLYDEKADRQQIESLAKSISDKYYPGFVQLHERLTTAGKAFASKNNISVNWDIRTSPAY